MPVTMKKTWYSLNLGDAMLAAEPLEQISHLFQSTYGDARSCEGLAIYFRHESEGRLHCEVRVYFPPGTADLANKVGASRCRPPSPDDLSVLTSL